MEEASRAKLREKSDIEVLVLNWNKNIIGIFRGDGEHKDDGVMKGLEPHPNLKELIIYCYMGKVFILDHNDEQLGENLVGWLQQMHRISITGSASQAKEDKFTGDGKFEGHGE